MKAKLIECTNKKFEKDLGKKGQIHNSGSGLMFAPKGQQSGIQTSTITGFDYNDGILVCNTLNSIYTFKICGKKSKEQAQKEFGSTPEILKELSLLSNHLSIGKIFATMENDLKKDGTSLIKISDSELLGYLQDCSKPLKEAIAMARKVNDLKT